MLELRQLYSINLLSNASPQSIQIITWTILLLLAQSVILIWKYPVSNLQPYVNKEPPLLWWKQYRRSMHTPIEKRLDSKFFRCMYLHYCQWSHFLVGWLSRYYLILPLYNLERNRCVGPSSNLFSCACFSCTSAISLLININFFINCQKRQKVILWLMSGGALKGIYMK